MATGRIDVTAKDENAPPMPTKDGAPRTRVVQISAEILQNVASGSSVPPIR